MSNLISTTVVTETAYQRHRDRGAEDDIETNHFDAELQASMDDPDPGIPHDEAMLQISAAVFVD